MTGDADILYGTPEQIACVRRAASLYRLLKDDPRFGYNGRIVVRAGDAPDLAETVMSVARLVGYASAQFVTYARGAELARTFAAAGMGTQQWNQFRGGEAAIVAARGFLADFTPPADLRLERVGADTPDEVIHAICRTSTASGVLVVPASFMRAMHERGTYLCVRDPAGAVLAVGGGTMAYHPDSAFAREAFWGMLATDPAARGRKLATWVGAQAILDLAERHGARGFSSGVKEDNAASQAMCAGLGVTRSDYVYAATSDPVLMGDAPITR